MPRRLQIPVQSSTVSRSDPHSDPVNGSTNPDDVKQNLITDVVLQLEKTGRNGMQLGDFPLLGPL